METQTPPPDYEIHRRSPGPSWPLLLALTAVICGTAALMSRNVYYTETEIMRGFYRILVGGTVLLLTLGFANRSLAAWLITLCGGALILWQANQQRRWGILHEEMITVVTYVEKAKKDTGSYPASLAGYRFRHPEFTNHVNYSLKDGKMTIGYFLNDPGTSYWYHGDSGFGYYPD